MQLTSSNNKNNSGKGGTENKKVNPGTYMDEAGNVWEVDKDGNKTKVAEFDYKNGTYIFPIFEPVIPETISVRSPVRVPNPNLIY